MKDCDIILQLFGAQCQHRGDFEFTVEDILGHSGDTVVVSNLKFETKSKKKYWGNIYKGII